MLCDTQYIPIARDRFLFVWIPSLSLFPSSCDRSSIFVLAAPCYTHVHLPETSSQFASFAPRVIFFLTPSPAKLRCPSRSCHLLSRPTIIADPRHHAGVRLTHQCFRVSSIALFVSLPLSQHGTFLTFHGAYRAATRFLPPAPRCSCSILSRCYSLRQSVPHCH